MHSVLENVTGTALELLNLRSQFFFQHLNNVALSQLHLPNNKDHISILLVWNITKILLIPWSKRRVATMTKWPVEIIGVSAFLITQLNVIIVCPLNALPSVSHNFSSLFRCWNCQLKISLRKPLNCQNNARLLQELLIFCSPSGFVRIRATSTDGHDATDILASLKFESFSAQKRAESRRSAKTIPIGNSNRKQKGYSVVYWKTAFSSLVWNIVKQSKIKHWWKDR